MRSIGQLTLSSEKSNTVLENETCLDRQREGRAQSGSCGLFGLGAGVQGNWGWFVPDTFLHFCSFHIFFKDAFIFTFCLFVIKVKYAH